MIENSSRGVIMMCEAWSQAVKCQINSVINPKPNCSHIMRDSTLVFRTV
jgi:hypothetical protein